MGFEVVERIKVDERRTKEHILQIKHWLNSTDRAEVMWAEREGRELYEVIKKRGYPYFTDYDLDFLYIWYCYTRQVQMSKQKFFALFEKALDEQD